MSAHLKQQIQFRTQSKGMSINALEREANLGRMSVWNIIHGNLKKPKLENIKAIAKVLGCSVEDLVGPNDGSQPEVVFSSPIKPKTHYRWDTNLFLEATKAVSGCINDKTRSELKLEKMISLISESYKYSLAKGESKIDKDFTKWLVERSL